MCVNDHQKSQVFYVYCEKKMIPKIIRIWRVLVLKSRDSHQILNRILFIKRSTLNILVWKLSHQSHSLFRKKKLKPFLSHVSSWPNNIDTSPRNQLSVESRGLKGVSTKKKSQWKLLFAPKTKTCQKMLRNLSFFV